MADIVAAAGAGDVAVDDLHLVVADELFGTGQHLGLDAHEAVEVAHVLFLGQLVADGDDGVAAVAVCLEGGKVLGDVVHVDEVGAETGTVLVHPSVEGGVVLRLVYQDGTA